MLDIFLSVFVLIKQTSNAKIESKRVAEGESFDNVKSIKSTLSATLSALILAFATCFRTKHA